MQRISQCGPIIVPLVTPKKIEDFFSLIDHVIKGGVKDLLFFGTTGEGKKIALREKKSLIQKIVPYVGNRARLYSALMCDSIEDAIELANFCEAQGFIASLLPPLLYGSDVKTIISQFLEKSSAYFFLYNAPGLSRFNMTDIVPFLKEKRILGMKDSLCDMPQLQELMQKYRSDTFKIYIGKETELDEAFRLKI